MEQIALHGSLLRQKVVYFQSGRIGADEEIDDTKGKTMEEIDEMIEERELKAGTQILEMVILAVKSLLHIMNCSQGSVLRQ